MVSTREKRLRILERRLGVNKLRGIPVIFYDSILYKDEPKDLIKGARMNDVVWERRKEESVQEFQGRISQDVKTKVNIKVGVIWLERHYLGLPKPNDNMPAYTPYSEVIKNLKVEKL